MWRQQHFLSLCLSFFSSLLCRSVWAQPQSVPVHCVVCDTAGEKCAVFLHRLHLSVQEKQSEQGDVQKQSSLIGPSAKHAESFPAMFSIHSLWSWICNNTCFISSFLSYFTKLLIYDVFFKRTSIYTHPHLNFCASSICYNLAQCFAFLAVMFFCMLQ